MSEVTAAPVHYGRTWPPAGQPGSAGRIATACGALGIITTDTPAVTCERCLEHLADSLVPPGALA